MNIRIAVTAYMIVSLICSLILVYYLDEFEEYSSKKSRALKIILAGLNLIIVVGAFSCIFAIFFYGIGHILFFIPTTRGQYVDALGGWFSYRDIISSCIAFCGGSWCLYKIMKAIRSLKNHNKHADH